MVKMSGIKELGSDLINESNPKKLHKKTKEYLVFQLYANSEFIYYKYGKDALQEYYRFNQDSFFNLKMSGFLKMMEGIIKKLPKSLKIKEGLKMMVKELEFLEPPKNIEIIEKTNKNATFKVNKCSIRKEFNKLARKGNKLELIDKCCLWCIESIPYANKYGFEYSIELTENGCFNYLK